MALTQEQRSELLRRADELRTEVSSLTAEHDAAVQDKSTDLHDAKLIAEVMNLEVQRDGAAARLEAVTTSSDQAFQIMQAAIERQAAEQTSAESTPTPSPDPLPESVELVEPPVDVPVDAPTEPATPASVGKIKNGGNR